MPHESEHSCSQCDMHFICVPAAVSCGATLKFWPLAYNILFCIAVTSSSKYIRASLQNALRI